MIYPKLEEYLNAMTYLYLTDEFFRKDINATGIRFDRLPKCEATRVGAAAQEFDSLALARHELSGDLAFLERVVGSLTLVPTKPEVVQAKLNELLQDQRVFEICEQGRLDPKSGRRLMREYRDDVLSNVLAAEFKELMSIMLPEWKTDVEAQKQLVKIRGFEMLSEMIGGFNPGRLALMMAETGFGKTNLALSLALKARRTMGVAYANMEMSLKDVAKRVAVLETGIPHAEFYRRVVSESWWKEFDSSSKDLFITDGRGMSPNSFKAWIRGMKSEGEVGLVIADYDQCFLFDREADEPEWMAMQKLLADLDEFSREVNVFLLVVAQLNRAGEIASSHRATYKAHTILSFENDPVSGPMIKAKKNRHGKKDLALRVSYDEESSRITEIEVMGVKKQTTELPRRQVKNYAPGQ